MFDVLLKWIQYWALCLSDESTKSEFFDGYVKTTKCLLIELHVVKSRKRQRPLEKRYEYIEPAPKKIWRVWTFESRKYCIWSCKSIEPVFSVNLVKKNGFLRSECKPNPRLKDSSLQMYVIYIHTAIEPIMTRMVYSVLEWIRFESATGSGFRVSYHASISIIGLFEMRLQNFNAALKTR